MVYPDILGCEKIRVPFLFLFQGAIREKNQDGIITTLDPFTPMSSNPLFEGITLPRTPLDKINKLLLSLSYGSDVNYGDEYFLKYIEDAPSAYAKDKQEFSYLLQAMKSKGYFAESTVGPEGSLLVLSMDAWSKIHDLLRSGLASKQGFVACWFDDQHDHYRHAIEAGIREAGYLPMSIKEKEFPDTILAQALGQIRRSRFVVVDLTEQRGSVFVEWGFAVGLDLKCILVIEADYWEKIEGERREALEFYSKNYKIRPYRDDAQLAKIVSTAIEEIIGHGNADLPA